MKTLQSLILISFLSVSLSSCIDSALRCQRASGNETVHEESLEAFTSIDLQMAADVVIEESEEYAVRIEGSDNLVEMIIAEVRNSELNIRLPRGACIRGRSDLLITVYTPEVREIKLSGSGDIRSTTGFSTETLDVDITGSGDIHLENLSISHFDADITGSGSIVIQGEKATSGEVRISGSGKLDAYGLEVAEAEINITGSGKAKVRVSDELDVDISGSGDVYYKGQPAITQNITGSGNIKNDN